MGVNRPPPEIEGLECPFCTWPRPRSGKTKCVNCGANLGPIVYPPHEIGGGNAHAEWSLRIALVLLAALGIWTFFQAFLGGRAAR